MDPAQPDDERWFAHAGARHVSPRAVRWNRRIERVTNHGLRGVDRALGLVGLGGREADYDDRQYCFVGGPGERMRAGHYDKSMRLLWKAEQHAPWSSFRDCTRAERALIDQAVEGMSAEEKAERSRINSAEFRAFLDETYRPEEKRALVAMLSAIGHGEAYAWLVSARLLGEVKSTGAKAALTMQVLEEAKHFVVMRELVQAFDVEVPPLPAWEYLLLEQVLRAEGLDKLFGMNVVVEGIALSLFGLLSHLPGLEVLRLFHLDESRHTALPANYLKEFPMSRWQRLNPLARLRRIQMVAPAVPLILHLEGPAAEMGLDIFELGGSILRKVTHLAEREGFTLTLPYPVLRQMVNVMFNCYCYATRTEHGWRDYLSAETTMGRAALDRERVAFGTAAPA